jgi:hypothetical protein
MSEHDAFLDIVKLAERLAQRLGETLATLFGAATVARPRCPSALDIP